MLFQVMVPAKLEARHAVDREAVIAAFLHLQVEDREVRRGEQAGVLGWSQASTCRSGTASSVKNGSRLPSHAPAVMTSLSAS